MPHLSQEGHAGLPAAPLQIGPSLCQPLERELEQSQREANNAQSGPIRHGLGGLVARTSYDTQTFDLQWLTLV